MKKLLITFVLLVCSVISFAQTEQHMKFMGIPMVGTLQSFTKKIEAKGYTIISMQDNQSVLAGSFCGYQNCKIAVVSEKGLQISMADVLFPPMDKWTNLFGCYHFFKDLLINKYGNPHSCVEKFQRGNIEDDNARMYELQMDRCNYKSMFVLKEGFISLEIVHTQLGCYVNLAYADKINMNKAIDKNIDDL